MRMTRLMGISLGLAFGLVSTIALAGQLPAAATVVPAGFKVVAERNLGASMVIEARKPNDNFPNSHQDEGIRLACSWSRNPMAARTVERLGQQPEDPAGPLAGVSRSEPCGRTPHKAGVLTCRRIITPWVGSGTAPDLVTWDVAWVGATSTGLLGVSVSSIVGSKDAAVALLDSVIDKVAK